MRKTAIVKFFSSRSAEPGKAYGTRAGPREPEKHSNVAALLGGEWDGVWGTAATGW